MPIDRGLAIKSRAFSPEESSSVWSPRTVIVLAGLVATLRFISIWRGWLDGELTLADDSFYYFQIARHVAQGLGPTFDGLAPTNGFHPLYLAGLSLLYRCWATSAWVPIHVALTCLVICDMLSARLMYAIARRWSPRAGVVAAAVWLTSPMGIATSQRGMESSLSTFFVLAGMLAFLRWLDEPRSISRGQILGFCLGLAALARTENFLFVLAVGISASILRPRAMVQLVFNVGLPFAVLITPWMLWQWQNFGTWEQSSGAAIRFLNIYGHLDFGGRSPWHPVALATQCRDVLEWLHRCALTQEYQPLGAWSRLYFYASMVVLLGSLGGGVYVWIRNHRRLSTAPLLPLAIYAALHFLYYFMIVRTYRPWYHLTLLAAAILLGAFATEKLTSRGAFRLILISWLLVQCAAVSVYTLRASRFETSRTAEGRISWIERHCGPTASVGMMNAGKLGYLASFRSRITVVNLDGVVNNQVLQAYRTDTFPRYFCATLDYIIELPDPQVFRDPKTRRLFRNFTNSCIEKLPTRPIPLFAVKCDGPCSESGRDRTTFLLNKLKREPPLGAVLLRRPVPQFDGSRIAVLDVQCQEGRRRRPRQAPHLTFCGHPSCRLSRN